MKRITIALLFLLPLLSIFCSNKPTPPPTANFVTFTGLQSMGLTLKSGKSAITSTSFANKRSIDSLYAVDDSYYAFAALGINDFVVTTAIQAAPTMNLLNGFYGYALTGNVGWAACSSASASIALTVYTDNGGSTPPVSGDHFYNDSYGTSNSYLGLISYNTWYYYNYDGETRYIQVNNNGTSTVVVYSGTSGASSGTNVGITSDATVTSPTSRIADVYAYATSAVNTDVTVSVHVIGDNSTSIDVDVTILNGSTSGVVSAYLGAGDGPLTAITSTYINSLTPTSYSGYNYNF